MLPVNKFWLKITTALATGACRGQACIRMSRNFAKAFDPLPCVLESNIDPMRIWNVFLNCPMTTHDNT